MRIVLVSETFYPHVSAVTEAVDLEYRELKRRGHEVWILTANQPDVLQADPQILEVPALPLPNGSPYHLTFPGIGQVDSVLTQADLIHIHEPFALGSWARDRGRAHGRPVVFTYHPEVGDQTHHVSLTDHSRRQPFSSRLRSFANSVSAVFAPHPHVAKALAESGITVPIHHVPTPIDSDALADGAPDFLHRQFELDPALPLTLLVTDFVDLEALELILGSVQRLPEQPHLVIVGTGPHRSSVEEQLHRSGANQSVHLLDAAPPGQLGDLYASAAVLIVPSTTSHDLHQAMLAATAGVPVLGLDTTPLRDLVINRVTGLLVLPTETAVGRALRQLLARPAFRARLGRQARRHAEQAFTPAHSVDCLFDVVQLTRRLHHVEA